MYQAALHKYFWLSSSCKHLLPLEREPDCGGKWSKSQEYMASYKSPVNANRHSHDLETSARRKKIEKNYSPLVG